jgi:hypothetical protein
VVGRRAGRHGAPLVFLHGFPKFWSELKNQLAEFSRDTRRWRQTCAVTTCRRCVTWVQREVEKLSDPADRLVDHQSAARRAVDRCQRADTRIAEGIDLIESDLQADEAFRFANLVMLQ